MSIQMSDLTGIIIFAVAACLIIAVGVWLFLRTEINTNRAESAATGSESGRINERRRMQTGDWFNAAISLIIGMLLGSVIDGLAQFITTGLWLPAVAIVFLGAGFFLFMLVFDKVGDRLFSIGMRPAPKRQAKGPTPLPRFISLPVGVVLGVVLARLGFDDTILGMIPWAS